MCVWVLLLLLLLLLLFWIKRMFLWFCSFCFFLGVTVQHIVTLMLILWSHDNSVLPINYTYHVSINANLFSVSMYLDTIYFTKDWKLKIENNKKINFDYCSQKKILFICLLALIMSHEHCKRCWSNKRKQKCRLLGRKRQSKQSLKISH